MTTENNKQLVRDFNDAFNRGDIDGCFALLAPECLAYQPGIPQPLNRDEFRQVGQMFLDSFGDSAFSYQEQIAEGEHLVTRDLERDAQRGVSRHSGYGYAHQH